VAATRELRAQLTDPAPVMEAAAAFIGVRPRSIEETRRRLLKLGYPAPLVDYVVVRLIEMGYLDDELFSRQWIESRDRAHPRGEFALRRELGLKGVDRAVIDAALAERSEAAADDDAERAGALALLERRRTSLERESDPRKRRQKAYAVLARHGFSPEACSEVAQAFVARS
jgi:regulatory protein